MAGWVDIELKDLVAEKPACVLIDDEPVVRLSWSLTAKRQAQPFRAYQKPQELFAESATLDRSTPVYVDAHLADEVNGIEIARCLFDAGFQKVYVATGGVKNVDAELYGLSGVVGKEPPFGSDCI
jgi:FixJ family two-component response regulator